MNARACDESRDVRRACGNGAQERSYALMQIRNWKRATRKDTHG